MNYTDHRLYKNIKDKSEKIQYLLYRTWRVFHSSLTCLTSTHLSWGEMAGEEEGRRRVEKVVEGKKALFEYESHNIQRKDRYSLMANIDDE